ncbi:MAG TPA: branched-chain amino acid ABC transporter permease [Chthoniobacterales bacterium]|nr:branched-chain amino acid ABC transporter permease [Chthoniobacterales bacterium]
MNEFLQQIINGLSLGAFYALIALGYTMVYGVLRFINFAHGDIFMIGAFCGYYLTPRLMPYFSGGSAPLGVAAVLLLTMAICALLGMTIEKLAYRPLRSQPRLTVLITAIGVSLFLEYGGQFVFGADPKGFPDLVVDRAIEGTGALTITTAQLAAFLISIGLLIGLSLIVKRTKLGMAMRAVSNNATAAMLMGVNIDTVISFTFGLGSALAGAAGILYAISYPSIDPLMGILPGIKAFVAAVLGGIGNIPGAAVGGILLGIVETFVGGSQFSSYRDAIAFAVLIIILLFRPAGLFGKTQVEKV